MVKYNTNSKIAKVSKTGKVTGVTQGSTTIKVTVKYKKAGKVYTEKLVQKIKVLAATKSQKNETKSTEKPQETDTPKTTDVPLTTSTPFVTK